MILSIGHRHSVPIKSIVTILAPDSAPVIKLKSCAAEEGRLINATGGRKTRSVIVLKNNDVVLCALQPETLKLRLHKLTAFKEINSLIRIR